MAVLCMLFTVIYAVVTSRVGYSYHGAILVPYEENGNTVYSGKIYGQEAVFTVTPDKTVTYHYGEKEYGPYKILIDPTAVPQKYASSGSVTGVEIQLGEEILFRGGIIKSGMGWMFYDENGTWYDVGLAVYSSNGIAYDENGNVVDSLKPSVATVWDVANDPELVKNGSWVFWFLGVFASIVTAVSILFADEMFRFGMAFRIRNAYEAEPSEWEMVLRYISWTVLPIVVIGIYILGLRQY